MRFESDQPTLTELLACTAFNVRRAARNVTRFYDEILEPVGLRITQFAVMSTIRVAGIMPIKALAQALGLDPSTLTRNLQPLIDRQLVQVERGDDQRIKELMLTAEGHHKLAAASGLWRDAQARVKSVLGQATFDELLKNLNRLSQI